MRNYLLAAAGTSALVLVTSVVGIKLPLLTSLFSIAASPVLTSLAILVGSVAVLRSAGVQTGTVESKLTNTALGDVSQWFGTKDVSKDADEYLKLHSEGQGGDLDARKSNYMSMVNHYYNLVTDFYEYGWGKSFHFGRRFIGEDFHASLARHEHWLAYRGGFKPGQTLIDVGCGVGGPMRCISRFTGANIIGINNNAYQIQRGTRQNEQAGLAGRCSFKTTDFMAMDFKDNSLDGAYAIEATCHAPDKVKCFSEIFRVLKPGAVFVGYEWCMTDKYDPKNEEHKRIKKGIEEGDGLPDICHTSEVVEALKKAGFVVEDSEDVAPVDAINNCPWYDTISHTGGFKNFKHSPIGTAVTHAGVVALETIGLAPKGSAKTHAFLCSALPALSAGGRTGIFTPMFFFKAIKPAN